MGGDGEALARSQHPTATLIHSNVSGRDLSSETQGYDGYRIFFERHSRIDSQILGLVSVRLRS